MVKISLSSAGVTGSVLAGKGRAEKGSDLLLPRTCVMSAFVPIKMKTYILYKRMKNKMKISRWSNG